MLTGISGSNTVRSASITRSSRRSVVVPLPGCAASARFSQSNVLIVCLTLLKRGDPGRAARHAAYATQASHTSHAREIHARPTAPPACPSPARLPPALQRVWSPCRESVRTALRPLLPFCLSAPRSSATPTLSQSHSLRLRNSPL